MKNNGTKSDFLLNHIAYLKDELNALKGVMDVIPYHARPAEGELTILEMIRMIGLTLTERYLPAVKRIREEEKPELADIQTFIDAKSRSHDPADRQMNAGDVIDSILENRTDLLNALGQLSVEDWDRPAVINGNEVTLAAILEEMVEFERQQFRMVAERVLSLDTGRNSP